LRKNRGNKAEMQTRNINKHKLSESGRRKMPFGFVKTISEKKGLSKRQVRNVISGRSQDLHGVFKLVIKLREDHQKELARIKSKLK
jgi:hypothetical protein